MAVSLGMTVLWLVQRRTGDAGIVDVGWAAALGSLAVFYALVLEAGLPARRALVAVLAAFWSVRLSSYLLWNRVLRGPEDGRYQAIRARWKNRLQLKLLGFFLAQGGLDAILSISFLVVMIHPADSLRWWDVVAAFVVLASVAGETLADRQLANWRADPANRGRTCRNGLWRYSRHPNYFFEWIYWLAWVVMAVGSPIAWASLIAPALMLFFILHVTGIPPTEARAVVTRGDDYRRYQATTSAFFPWFPKRDERAR